MSIWTSAYIAFGILIAVLGVGVFVLNTGADKRMRQTALLFCAVGLVVAAFAALATILPSHSH